MLFLLCARTHMLLNVCYWVEAESDIDELCGVKLTYGNIIKFIIECIVVYL